MPTILGLPAAAASVVCHRRAGSGLRRCLAVREAVRSEPLESRKVWAQHRAAALGEIDIMAKRVGGVLKKSSPRGRSISSRTNLVSVSSTGKFQCDSEHHDFQFRKLC